MARVRVESSPIESLPDDLILNILGRVAVACRRLEEIYDIGESCPRLYRMVYHPEVLNQLPLLFNVQLVNPWVPRRQYVLSRCLRAGHPIAQALVGFYRMFRVMNPDYAGEELLIEAASNGRGGLASYMRGIHWLVEALDAHFGAEEMLERAASCMRHSFIFDSEACCSYRRATVQFLFAIWRNRPDQELVPIALWRMHHRHTDFWYDCDDVDCARHSCEIHPILLDDVGDLECSEFCSERCRIIYELVRIVREVNRFMGIHG